MHLASFLTRTRHRGRIDITDWLAWFWLLFGTFAVALPIAWAIMSSLKQPSEITRFPPSFLPIAPVQVEAHRRKLVEYERVRDTMPESVPKGPRLALDAGIANARQQIAWWNEVMVSRS